MPQSRTVITVASWEDRFLEGLKKTLAEASIERILMLFLDDYANWTEEPRRIVREHASKAGIELREKMLLVADPAENWRRLHREILSIEASQNQYLVDLTTMPREIIWTTLWLLELKKASIAYSYHRPQSYNKEWLSRNAQHPRLVYKLSGLSKLGAKTALVAIAGYDPERVHQLRTFFEPSHTLLGLQLVDGDSANGERMNEHRERFEREKDVEIFELDAYGSDNGEASILKQMKGFVDSHNVVMSSLGPKLSALSLYRIQRAHPAVALAYAPSREFNRGYSSGLAQSFKGEL